MPFAQFISHLLMKKGKKTIEKHGQLLNHLGELSRAKADLSLNIDLNESILDGLNQKEWEDLKVHCLGAIRDMIQFSGGQQIEDLERATTDVWIVADQLKRGEAIKQYRKGVKVRESIRERRDLLKRISTLFN